VVQDIFSSRDFPRERLIKRPEIWYGTNMNRTKYDRDRLLFRRQFVLGSRFVQELPTWRQAKAGPGLCLTVHPDLPFRQAQDGSTSVTLLGYLLDPFDPQAADAEIVDRLHRKLQEDRSLDGLIRSTYSLGGRWILIGDNGQSIRLFHDACGLRQVFYTQRSSSGVWCASQPGLLARLLRLDPDDEAWAFIRAHRKRDPEYWWPVDSSPYRQARRLLPNHYLDLNTGMSHRYWPTGDITRRTLKEVVEENAPFLQGLIESAARRFDLAPSITAGKDTRLLLAASRTVRERLYCFTTLHWDLTRNSPDIAIPSRLLSRLGLPHHIIPCPSQMDREFRQIYRSNVPTARDAYGTIAQGLYESYPSEKVCVKGNVSPITGLPYHDWLRERPGQQNGEIDPQVLGWLTNREEEFALRALARWVSDVDHSDVDILDLFWWEDREGSWQATSQLEFDIVREVVSPFNCRLFLTITLSLPGSYRGKPAYAFHMEMARRLWPEVLQEPINPPARPSLMSIARGFLKRPGCMNWRWLGSQIARNWLVTEPGPEDAPDAPAERSL
jgi:hypothetical protein